MVEKVKIGTRGSSLALWQTRLIEMQLRRLYPDLIIEIEIIKTKGDKILDQALSKIEGKGLFTKEIEDKLLDSSIDMAVHSLKDMPTELPEGLALSAITKREDPADALLSKNNLDISELPEGSIILTSSLRRKSQLLSLRPDLQIADIRGNIETRIMKYRQSNAQGMILATAGLKRLELDSVISHRLTPELFIPACGQGALAIETREGDSEIIELLSPLNDRETEIAITAERTFLAAMGGGCQVPMGAYCKVENDKLQIYAFSGEMDGSLLLFHSGSDTAERAYELGQAAAEGILRQK